MSKLFLLLIFVSNLLFAKDFLIETSQGPERISIPTDMGVEEAFLEMAELYLEERYDLEESLDMIDVLTLEIKEYMFLVATYEKESIKLQNEFEELIASFEVENRVNVLSPILFFGTGIEPLSLKQYFSTRMGIVLFEQFYGLTEISYPLRFGISLGFTW